MHSKIHQAREAAIVWRDSGGDYAMTLQNLATGAGQTIIAAGAGATISTPETPILAKQKATATLVKVATNEWDLMGNLMVV